MSDNTRALEGTDATPVGEHGFYRGLDGQVYCKHGVEEGIDCPSCDAQYAGGYDADRDDPSQYCKHGTFIGSWWGPDYLCGQCESE